MGHVRRPIETRLPLPGLPIVTLVVIVTSGGPRSPAVTAPKKWFHAVDGASPPLVPNVGERRPKPGFRCVPLIADGRKRRRYARIAYRWQSGRRIRDGRERKSQRLT